MDKRHLLWVGRGHMAGQEKMIHQFLEDEMPDWMISFHPDPDSAFRLLASMDQVEENTIHAAVVDVVLPGISGLEFCQRLQENEIPIPTLLLLDPGSEATMRTALEYGVNDCLVKDHHGDYLGKLPRTITRAVIHTENCIALRVAHKRLLESEEKFQKAFMLSPTGMTISTLEEGRILEVNENVVKQFGFSRQELIGSSAVELGIFSVEDRSKIKHLLLEEGAFADLELKLFTKSREERLGLFSGQRVTVKGEPCIILSVNDITLRKKMEEELLKNKNIQSIGVLAGGIARDFNNFLTSILGSIQLAKLYLHDANRIHKALNRAEEAAIQAGELAAKMITFSEGGEPIFRDLSLPAIISNIIAYSFFKSDITFDYHYSHNLWKVKGDETQLTQFFYNILLNARQAMSNGGNVDIYGENISLSEENEWTLPPGRYIKIDIQDPGVGISKENLGKVFDPFFSTQDTVAHPGVGMGLSICRSIIKKHGGAISIESEVHKGTKVTTLLPVFESGI